MFTPEGLFTLLSDVLGNTAKLAEAAGAMRTLARPEATRDVASLVEAHLANRGHTTVAAKEVSHNTPEGQAFSAIGGVM